MLYYWKPDAKLLTIIATKRRRYKAQNVKIWIKDWVREKTGVYASFIENYKAQLSGGIVMALCPEPNSWFSRPEQA